jgi:putative solute:sodium symporter small subunit
VIAAELKDFSRLLSLGRVVKPASGRSVAGRWGENDMPLVESQEVQGARTAAVDRATGEAYWKKTSGLMWTVLAIWFVAGFGIHLFAPLLNPIHILGFPLGFYMAAQGSLIIFVVALFWFGKRQNQIDEEFGVQED